MRPVIRYHGGKKLLAPWIVSHFPAHRIYVEPYCGAASVLLHKPRAYSEVINDLDSDVVNLFRVLQSPKGAEELERLLRVTPYAREEFKLAYEKTTEPIEQARRTIIRAFMGFASAAATYESGAGARIPTGFRNSTKNNRHCVGPESTPTGFRANSNRSGTTPAHDWVNYSPSIPFFTERMQGVVIENRDAVEIIRQHDFEQALHYVDPPYPQSTRDNKLLDYRHEMTDDQHRELAAVLHKCAGMVVLSGYPCDLYDAELYPDWQRVTKSALADGARKRVEVLWLNPAASSRGNGRLAL